MYFYLTAPGDYDGTDVTMTFMFPGGITEMFFPIPIVNDSVAESVEQFTISLSTTSSLGNAIVLGPNSTVQINDNDRKIIIYNNYIVYYWMKDKYPLYFLRK